MNEGRWPSEMLIVMFPLIVSGLKVFVKILSMSVLELLFSFVGSDMEGRRWLEHIMSKNSADDVCLEKFSRSTLKSPAKCIFLFLSFDKDVMSGLKCSSLK